MEKLTGRLESASNIMEVDDDEEDHGFERARVSLRLMQASAANNQDNFALAFRLMSDSLKVYSNTCNTCCMTYLEKCCYFVLTCTFLFIVYCSQ